MSGAQNPCAFPEAPADFNGYEGRPGMSLRDWFAGQALGGLIEQSFAGNTSIGHQSPVNWATKNAYRFADAMLAARATGQGEAGK